VKTKFALVAAVLLALTALPAASAVQTSSPAQSGQPAAPASSAPPVEAAVQPAAKAAPVGHPKPAPDRLSPEAAKTAATGIAAWTGQTSDAVRIALVLSVLALIPALFICMTPFVRIIVVLSMIRHAFGMPETPPNQVLVVLALFLTTFVMMPTFTQVNQTALQPFLGGTMPLQQAIDTGAAPMRDFMLRQVHDSDLKTVYDISRQPLPDRAQDVGIMQLTSAFMLNELRVSFKIGFVIMLPFLLIDLVVSSILLSLGMIMVPPTTLSLPIKVLMFVLIDGWSLILQGVVGSFR
jgi:flagellar biosynthetic protein FliP